MATFSNMTRSLILHRPLRAAPRPAAFSTITAQKLEKTNGDAVQQPAKDTPEGEPKPRKKSVAEQDEELRAKLSGMSDEGGEAGVEYENGKPVAMKHAVRSNMFRIMPFRGK